MHQPLRVLDAARQLRDEINALIDGPGRRLLYDKQLRSSAGSIAANIREAHGRRKGPERNQFLRVARGSAEETDEHLQANVRPARLPEKQYFRFHNRIVAIVRMLNAMMAD